MYRHSLIVVILLECAFVSCTGGSVCLYARRTTTTTTIHPSGKHDGLQWDTEDQFPDLDLGSIRAKTDDVSPAASAARLAQDRRRTRDDLCDATLATKIDNCTQTFERLFYGHKLTTAKTSITDLETQHLCRKHDESLYCLHIELMACPPRADHLERIAEAIGCHRDYMERLCRHIRQTQNQAPSTAPIHRSPSLESYTQRKTFNQLKHTGSTIGQKTATDRSQPAADITADSSGHIGHSNLPSEMLPNDNVHNEDKVSAFNKKINHKISNIKVFEENTTEADSIHTSRNSAATMPMVEPQILSKRNNPWTHNSSPSQVSHFRCLRLQLICGFILTVATFHCH